MLSCMIKARFNTVMIKRFLKKPVKSYLILTL